MLSSLQLIAHAQVNDSNSAIGQDIRAVLYSWYNANFFLRRFGPEAELKSRSRSTPVKSQPA